MVLALFGSLSLDGDNETRPQSVDSVGSQDDLEVPERVEDHVKELERRGKSRSLTQCYSVSFFQSRIGV